MKNNRNKAKLILKNKKSYLQEFIEINNSKEDKIKIKMVLYDNIYNMSYMFHNCVSLLKLSKIISSCNIENLEEELLETCPIEKSDDNLKTIENSLESETSSYSYINITNNTLDFTNFTNDDFIYSTIFEENSENIKKATLLE